MICEKCKMREANVQIVEIVNGVKNEHFLCAQCAGEMELSVKGENGSEMPLAKLLANLLSQTMKNQKKPECANVVCPTCGTTYEQFINESKLGCADCYKVFDLLISDNIKQLQGSDIHTGKHPKNGLSDIPDAVREELEESLLEEGPDAELLDKVIVLRRKIKEAVANEEYETAADLRDEMKAIEEKMAERAIKSSSKNTAKKTTKKTTNKATNKTTIKATTKTTKKKGQVPDIED